MRKLFNILATLIQPMLAIWATSQHNFFVGNIVLLLALVRIAFFPLAIAAVATWTDSDKKPRSGMGRHLVLFCESLTAVVCAGAGWWVSAFGYLIGALTTAIIFEVATKRAKITT